MTNHPNSMRNILAGFGRRARVEAPAMLGSACLTTCEATLPSSSAVDKLMNGDAWAIPAVVLSTALRAGLISAGAYLAGVRGTDVAKAGIGGALGIEAFVLGYVGYQKAVEAKRRAEVEAEETAERLKARLST